MLALFGGSHATITLDYHRRDFAAWGFTRLALQHGLGILPERRIGCGARDFAYFGVAEKTLKARWTHAQS
jgi:hypothetical protein